MKNNVKDLTRQKRYETKNKVKDVRRQKKRTKGDVHFTLHRNFYIYTLS